ncbi:MAG: hypothetical protein AAF587_31035 [Bacteroidota bacterium]
MKYFIVFSLTLFAFLTPMTAQTEQNEDLPYEQIPDYPEDYTSGNILSRFIDGLGYRYYWATEGLRSEDLAYKPSEEARTARQTLEHLYGLCETIMNAPQRKANVRPVDWSKMSFEELRKGTLLNLQTASELCAGKTEREVSEFVMIFQRGENATEFPYWNMINGPISDALWHVGQIVSFRRASGNPLHPGVSVLRGKTRK